MNGGYVYTYSNKKGEVKDYLVMDAKTPKESTHIISTRWGKWIKPTRKPITIQITLRENFGRENTLRFGRENT